MTNSVVLVGRLVKDVELKYTGTGVAVGNFTLAIDRAFKNANGEKETDFINCVIWRKPAESLAEYAGKGSLISVEGSMQVRNYTNKEDKKVYVTEVIAEKFRFLDSKKDNQSAQSGNDPFTKNSQPIDIPDDGLPF